MIRYFQNIVRKVECDILQSKKLLKLRKLLVRQQLKGVWNLCVIDAVDDVVVSGIDALDEKKVAILVDATLCKLLSERMA